MSDITIDRYRPPHEPTEAQVASGNYPKRIIRWNGLVIRIENEAGSIRSGYKPDGSMWETRMVYPYGYVSGTEGVDGDEVDVFVGANPEAPMVYVIHQRKVNDWDKYDEDKCLIGFDSEEDAIRAFLLCYDDERFLGPITAMPVPEFVAKVRATKKKPSMIKGYVLWKINVKKG